MEIIKNESGDYSLLVDQEELDLIVSAIMLVRAGRFIKSIRLEGDEFEVADNIIEAGLPYLDDEE